MEVSAWTAGSNGPTEMCGVIPEINGGYTSGKSGWGILGKKVRVTPHWSLGTTLTTVELCLRLGKGIAMEEEIEDQQSKGNQGANGDGERNEGSARDRESAKLEGIREDGKDASSGESSGKAGGSKRGPQENREGGNDVRTSPRNSAGATPKKTEVSDASRKPTEIEKWTAKFGARFIEQMMAGDEEDPQGAGSREGRRTGQDEAWYEGKDMPSKKGKDKNDPPTEGMENAMTPPAIDSGTSRLPASPKVTGACDGLWSLKERVLGWFDPEGTPKTREKQRESKEGEETSADGEAGSSEGGLKRIVTTLTRALNKNQGYLADAKKKLTFDGANIMEFLIDYENLAALLKWTEEEKMEHLGQHVSLSLGRDIMAIVASLKGEILGPRGERVNWNSPEGMRRAVILLNNLETVAVEAEPIAKIVWDQPRGRGPQANFILEGNGQDRVNITTRRAGADKKLIRDTVMEEAAGASAEQEEAEVGEQEKVYGKTREEEPVDKATAAKKKFRYQIPILTLPELDDTLSKLLGTMVSVSFQTMLQASPRLLKGLRQLLTRRRIEVEEAPEPQEQGPEEAEAPQGMQVTPMGFTNAVAEVQRRMLVVTGDMFPEKCEPYIDDNRVKGARYKDETEVKPGVQKFVWDHLHDIKDLLQRFLLYNITASGPKSILAVPEVTILGFRCGAYGRRPDPTKTDKISQWPTPLRTTTEVRAFLGVVGFWRIFIKDFAKIAEPILAMIREDDTMDWTEDREEAALTLKDILSSDQVTLAAPCFNDEVGRPFILETDGGPLSVGGVLIQRSEEGKERPIRFESRTLNSAERRYSQFKKEVLAILHCLKTFQAYLLGRWIGFIWQFDYKVERIAGLRNRADGLSRVCITPEGVEDEEPIDAFLEYEGVIFVVDNEMADLAITTGMVTTYCQTCLICQERSSVRVYEPLRPTRVLGPGHLVHLDLAVMPVSTDGFRYILDARDNLNGYVEAVALKKKTEKAVANWVEDFYLRHPFVRRFIADNGTKFVNQDVLNRLKTLCVPIKITEPYHPEANAPVKRGHRTLKNTIAKLAADNLGNWSRYLKQTVFSENMTPKRTMGCIPAELWYGREIDFPVEALVPTWNRLDDNPHLTTEELITARCQQVARNEEALEEVVNRVTDNRMKDKARSEEGQSSRQAGESSSRKRKLYVGFDHNLVVNRGGKKQGTRGPSPLKEGEPIELPSDSDPSSKEEGNLEKRQRMEEGNPEEGQRPGENEPVEFIDLTSDEEEDEVRTPTREERGREDEPGEVKDKWIEEFGPTFNDWFDQWGTILRFQWITKARAKLGRGEDLSPTTFFTEQHSFSCKK
ncbi:hypothetical protein CBR_g4311 [Chara braunii]|uniref:Integrase catalytic domain-containing protein n=1 Tax=Chara braunii TaxID=69332 RepID=A0A388JRB5_CHABU|nr:hypothetical protein CBR_g4311 [Chara braunii]|eukprot:GBG60354.1 hypothetical protein CBR_g4311 [Chara braunii]